MSVFYGASLGGTPYHTGYVIKREKFFGMKSTKYLFVGEGRTDEQEALEDALKYCVANNIDAQPAKLAGKTTT
jgi:hypothetical protein